MIVDEFNAWLEQTKLENKMTCTEISQRLRCCDTWYSNQRKNHHITLTGNLIRGLRSFGRAILIFDAKTNKPLRGTNAISQFYAVIVDAADEYKLRELKDMFNGYSVSSWIYSRTPQEILVINQNIVDGLNRLGYDIRFVETDKEDANAKTDIY